MKKPKLEALDVARWLQDLTDQQFIAFFYEHLSDRHLYREERRYLESHLVLANAKRARQDDGTAEEWRVEVLCSTPAQKWAASAPVCQFGTHCGYATASVGKQSQCPICGAAARGS
jgi:rubrerythrin